MRKKEKLFHSTNKKTVASLGLSSYDADGTLVLNGVYVKAYEINKSIMKNVNTKDNKEKIRFIYLSSDGISCQLFMVVYFESIDDWHPSIICSLLLILLDLNIDKLGRADNDKHP